MSCLLFVARLAGRCVERAVKRVALWNLLSRGTRVRRSPHETHGDATSDTVVELRLWKADAVSCSNELRPMAVPAILTRYKNEPTVIVRDDDGNALPLPPEELTGQCFGSVLVFREPSARQAQLIAEAVARGYAVEPRLVGKTLLALEEM